jgi:subtilisin family serine protease
MAYEYIANGKRIVLPVDPERVAVRFRSSVPSGARATMVSARPEVGPFSRRYEIPNESFTILPISETPGATGPTRARIAITAMDADPGVARVAPVFKMGNATVVATDRIIVGFHPDSANKAEEIIQAHGGEIVGGVASGYLVRLDETSDPFVVAEQLNALPEVRYAEPDFVTIAPHMPQRVPPPNVEAATVASVNAVLARNISADGVNPATASKDPFLKFQYAMEITGARNAWQSVSGKATIRVAILDEGVDAVHEDLTAAFVDRFDAHPAQGPDPKPWDAHGTACAGLAVGVPDNGLGIRGVGGGCSLLAARIAYSPFPGADWVSTSSGIAQAITWAWNDAQADVLSNSWGGGPESTAITDAFEAARTLGRGGRGCVIVIAAGNDSGPVTFPGTLPNVLTVSASNEQDEPKTKTSADGEYWWGSNFGPEVDVAAPGVHNYTTDITGSDGYNAGGTLNANYVHDFNGTSSATPIVAGAAALILSKNPNLTEGDVRQVIKATADKVGTVVYTNGRNDQMGHGRLNVLAAVNAVKTP